MKNDIQNLIKDLISQKFRVNEREWHLNQTFDQINVYLDQKNINLNKTVGAVNKEEIKQIFLNNIKSSSTSMNSSIVFLTIGFLLIKSPLVE